TRRRRAAGSTTRPPRGGHTSVPTSNAPRLRRRRRSPVYAALAHGARRAPRLLRPHRMAIAVDPDSVLPRHAHRWRRVALVVVVGATRSGVVLDALLLTHGRRGSEQRDADGDARRRAGEGTSPA